MPSDPPTSNELRNILLFQTLARMIEMQLLIDHLISAGTFSEQQAASYFADVSLGLAHVSVGPEEEALRDKVSANYAAMAVRMAKATPH